MPVEIVLKIAGLSRVDIFGIDEQHIGFISASEAAYPINYIDIIPLCYAIERIGTIRILHAGNSRKKYLATLCEQIFIFWARKRTDKKRSPHGFLVHRRS